MSEPSLSHSEQRLWRRARAYAENQQLAAAQATLESLVQRVPDMAPVHMELAGVLLRRGQMRASTHRLRQAAGAGPRDAQTCTQLVQRLYLGGEVVAARACLDHFESLPAPTADVLATQAHLRWMLGEISAAKALIQRATDAGVDTPDEWHLQAMVLQFTGDMDGAERMFNECLRRWPMFSGAALGLANLRKQTRQAHHLVLLRDRLARTPADSAVPGDRRVRAEFLAALFKELDDLEHYDEAWNALEQCNALMRGLNPYDGAGESAVAEALIAASDVIAGNPHPPPSGHDGPVPIFIVGLPRSGTTLLDRMLSSHSQVASAGEINDVLRQLHWAADVPPGGVPAMLEAVRRSPGLDFRDMGARYLQQTQWRAQGRPFYIDKLPTNILMVPFIRRALPHARILHMVREPMEVCFSNLRAMFGNVSPYSYDMEAVAHYYGLYARMADHWRATLPDAMLDVAYADLVAEPATTLRKVLRHCGLDIEEQCLHPERNAAPVATPSSAQVREPIHTRGLGHWRHYERHLLPMRAALERLSVPA